MLANTLLKKIYTIYPNFLVIKNYKILFIKFYNGIQKKILFKQSKLSLRVFWS